MQSTNDQEGIKLRAKSILQHKRRRVRVARLEDAHLTSRDLALLLAADREEVFVRIFLHHLTLCPKCRELGGFILKGLAEGEIDEELGRLSLGLYWSRVTAPKLWQELEAVALQDRMKLVKRRRRFWSWGLAELLCDRSMGFEDEPSVACALAELAVEVSLRVKDEIYPTWVQLLRGYAWAHLVRARRRSADLSGAWQALLSANEVWNPAIADLGDVLGYEERFQALLLGQNIASCAPPTT
jgi:hypothetical protein